MQHSQKCEAIFIRSENDSDVRGVHQVNRRAFTESALGYSGEAELVDKIRSSKLATLGLVAERDGLVVGHILFTPVSIAGGESRLEGVGLAPMAVVPELQGQGIGARLVAEGLEQLKQRGVPFVVVLGHPNYYPRFGFEPSTKEGVRCEFEGVPDDAFLLLVLSPEVSIPEGVAHYLPEFGAVT